MKYLKKYENFSEMDLGRFNDEEADMNEPDYNDQLFSEEDIEDEEEYIDDEDKVENDENLYGEYEEDEDDEDFQWGDENETIE